MEKNKILTLIAFSGKVLISERKGLKNAQRLLAQGRVKRIEPIGGIFYKVF